MINRREVMIAGGVAAAAGLFGKSPVLNASLKTKSKSGKLKIRNVRTLQVVGGENQNRRAIYVEITTEDGPTGLYGPINKEQAFVIHSKFRSLLVGRDALAGQALWDKMRRRDRHARSSLFMMAISAVDNALWDIRGKHFGVPVYRLLGGPTRDRVGAYASMLGYSVEPDKAGKIAREYFDRGFTAQKWF
ncbi:MAG: enolase-like domain-containing protein, partial [Planctomycetota bacterium]